MISAKIMTLYSSLGCDTIKKWLLKCQDDSETANYIAANTKDVSVFGKGSVA